MYTLVYCYCGWALTTVWSIRIRCNPSRRGGGQRVQRMSKCVNIHEQGDRHSFGHVALNWFIGIDERYTQSSPPTLSDNLLPPEDSEGCSFCLSIAIIPMESLWVAKIFTHSLCAIGGWEREKQRKKFLFGSGRRRLIVKDWTMDGIVEGTKTLRGCLWGHGWMGDGKTVVWPLNEIR